MAYARLTLPSAQVIHVLKLVLEAPLETPDELSQLTDFEALTLDLLKYVSQLLPSLATLVIKKKTCELMELAMDKKAAIPFKAEFKWRNQVTEIIIEWCVHTTAMSQLFARGRGVCLVAGCDSVRCSVWGWDAVWWLTSRQDERLCERDEGGRVGGARPLGGAAWPAVGGDAEGREGDAQGAARPRPPGAYLCSPLPF